MTVIEETCRWLCERDGADPDEAVRPTPAGPALKLWQLYEPGARWLASGSTAQVALQT